MALGIRNLEFGIYQNSYSCWIGFRMVGKSTDLPGRLGSSLDLLLGCVIIKRNAYYCIIHRTIYITATTAVAELACSKMFPSNPSDYSHFCEHPTTQISNFSLAAHLFWSHMLVV